MRQTWGGGLKLLLLSELTSRSEQVPGREFHPRDKSDKIDCRFLRLSWFHKKVNLKKKVSCGSYELLVHNVAHQMKEKLMIQNKCSNFLREILLKFEEKKFLFEGLKTT